MQPSEIREIHNLSVNLEAQDPQRTFLRLHFGEPDLGTPDFIIEAGVAALRGGAVFYENNSGRPDLRQALSEFHGLDEDRFVVTCGATQAICLTMLALLRPHDDVFIVTPLWPNFTESSRIAGARIHEVPLRFHDNELRFGLDLEALEEAVVGAAKPRMVVVNSPANPSGWVISEQEQTQLVEFCGRHGMYLICDEIYDRIVYTPTPPASFKRFFDRCEHLVVINGFSKAYCMTGWRVGYLISSPALAAELARMQEFVTSHAPSMAQVAAITALRDGEGFIANALERYDRLRRITFERLSTLPDSVVARTDGTFYVFFRARGTDDSMRFCTGLLEETGVSLAPGRAFGAGGEGWIRVCFAKESEVLEDAADRIRAYSENHP